MTIPSRPATLLMALAALPLLQLGPVAQAHDSPVKHTHLAMTNQPRTAMVWYRDLVYDKAFKDPDQVSLDLYVPDPTKEKMPVALFVHGGGFRSSDKAYYKDLGDKPEWFTQKKGFIFASMNHRLLPDGGYPASFQDVATALKWLSDNIAQYGGDPSQIFLVAHATGLHSAALVATDESFLRAVGKDLSLIMGLVGIDGAFFDVTKARSGVVQASLPNADEAMLRKASPLFHVEKGKAIPPMLILYGAQGGDVKDQSERMAAALRVAGLQGQAMEMAGKDHFTANEHIGTMGDATTLAVDAFLDGLTRK
jgi:arylformamidase